ncbi:MAG: threonylcarbamoyl-AMP synthase [Alphaproteobacteria bacterium]|nr:threonylcarbamoyl-AMP synthase [Alphaproteobacteria bacterium]PHX99552.1 MAG: threonylcarbamoyl-AMP synthase [Rhodospirillaceae bacterium]
MSVVAPTPENIAKAAQVLRDGGLVAFPTETVYGLGGDATQDSAVEKIYAAKGRPSFNPLIVHVGGVDWVADIAQPDARFDSLVRAFWPGPLTLVLNRHTQCAVSKIVSAGRDSIAVRMPDHPVAHDLLMATQRPLAAPSANRSGFMSPTEAAHVLTSLDALPEMIIDGGQCRVGLESTVLDLTQTTPAILRPGSITREQIEAVIGPVSFGRDDPLAPKSPGQLASHYAPGLPVRLNATEVNAGEVLVGFGPVKGALTLSLAGDLAEAAANLFAVLRQADNTTLYNGIAVAPVPELGVGLAINDRLRRAAAPRNTAS